MRDVEEKLSAMIETGVRSSSKAETRGYRVEFYLQQLAAARTKAFYFEEMLRLEQQRQQVVEKYQKQLKDGVQLDMEPLHLKLGRSTIESDAARSAASRPSDPRGRCETFLLAKERDRVLAGGGPDLHLEREESEWDEVLEQDDGSLVVRRVRKEDGRVYTWTMPVQGGPSVAEMKVKVRK
jgi:hypothetical protein